MEQQQESKILRLPKVKETVGLGKSAIYAMIKEGKFPKPIKIGVRASGWLDTDIRRWLAARPTLPDGNDDCDEK
ncbi:helix-turn-helix transcriptional regulator [Acidithiobacillus sulfuriphilus]|uniref:AlpA family transcriptional regulator n=2 Tax=Acidithiobacillus sulfuriphilus TaxID=1867749 RepID=A0A3M8RD13_9PROT|nr:AlpA family transcriptional regulator [Acidithiobacillus sulfuriphilus]RNF66463.1 AlpA family transcriptional regulator [Acidithiobacillus sulfuriphilus]